MAARRAPALVAIEDPLIISNARQIAELALQNRLPMIGFKPQAEAGALMEYGVDLADLYSRSAAFVDKILKGTPPAELPIERAVKFELIVNLKTAKALGIELADIAAAARRRGDRMRRREFITLLGGAAAAWPLAARAQQAERMRRIGVLMNLAADDPEGQARIAAFLQGLQQLGWTDGRNVRIDYRWAAAMPTHSQTRGGIAGARAGRHLGRGHAKRWALQQATRTVPIVFADVTDPVGAGFVDSLARPGGNATGFITFEYGISAKWLELLKEIAPSVTRVAVLRDPHRSGIGQFAAIQAVAPSFGVELSPVDVRDAGEIERAVAAFARSPNGGLIVTASRRRPSIAS